ncbi:hypothetical protein GGI15_000930 [Coemansia interrupta]|uniref:CCHC-type domain-containing protein n=1 Tax=Coemansia interrupta TaxID=1126814 RepID=A0A9W8HJ00_9FUNG|nr:hypothetical protein GGI15_000930 [Coemansia interrupta]
MPEATEPVTNEALYGNASDSDSIDSDTQERVLSFIYHQSADQAAAMVAASPARQKPIADNHSDDEDAEDSKYNIGTKPRLSGTASADSTSTSRISVAVVRPFRSSTLTEDEDADDASDVDMDAGKKTRYNGNSVSYNASDDEAVGEYLDSVATSGQLTPTRPLSSTLSNTPFVDSVMEQQSISIDSVSLQEPIHAVQIRHAGESEYDYLDGMEIMGHNRYFMEEKKIICRKCNGAGHIAKDCDVVICIKTHHADECQTIWRKYVYMSTRRLVYEDVTAWCYNCAHEGHFGDDCPYDYPSWSVAFYEHTAYRLRNCPGNVPEDTSIRNRKENHPRRDYQRSSTTPINQRLGPRNSFSDSKVRKDWRNKGNSGPRSEHRGDRSRGGRNDNFTPSKPYRPNSNNSSFKRSGHNYDKQRSARKNNSK